MGLNLDETHGNQVEEISKVLWEVLQRLRKSEPGSYREEQSGIPLWIQYLMEQLPAELRGNPKIEEPLARAWVAACYWNGDQELTLPPGADHDSCRDEWNRLHGSLQELSSWFLYEEPLGIRFSRSELEEGFFISRFEANGNLLSVLQEGEASEMRLEGVGGFIPWKGIDLLLQSPGGEKLGLLGIKRPPWATKWIRTREGIEVEALARPEEESVVDEKTTQTTAIKRRLRWHLPELGVHGFWENDAGEIADQELDWDLLNLLPTEWKVGAPGDGPAWASRKGTDDFGSYAEWEHEGVVFRFRWIPPGEFLMGSPEEEKGRWSDEGPQHEVQLTKGFWMLETPVTQELWLVGGRENPSHFNGEKRPVENVSWDDCQKWLEDLSRKFPGMDVRLPTEAEWEYACRAGTTSAFHNNKECTEPEGKDAALNEIGWYRENSGSETHEVRQKKANGWGLYDMHGNVWEWCENFWSDRYPPGRQQNPKGPSGGSYRVLRGGCWDLNARKCRSAYRIRYVPDDRDFNAGFRFLLQAGSRQGSPERDAVKGAPPGGEKTAET
jgi:formylglycine-generating enzyme required for sulfatase activity